MKTAPLRYARILSNAMNEILTIKSHEILGLPAGTYHKFIMPDGTEFLLNDFGVRSITLADNPDKL